jgi:hypothetical protein
MIAVIRNADRHHADMGWLSTYWHFSFADYHDPENMGWGPLRVFNDDVIQPGKGFGAHPHRDMEIITYVLDGELEHKDNQGNTGVVRPGEVQVMSAGKGIVHSEYNASADRPVHLLQIWIVPRTRGLTPRWAQRQFIPAQRAGRFLPVVAGHDLPNTLTIDQDAVICVASLRAGQALRHTSGPGRKAYLFAMAGRLAVNATELAAGDQARIADEPDLHLMCREDAEVILMDLPREP